MTDPVWLGIDLGTQSVRALAADSSGTVLASAAESLSSRRDGVQHVQDPADWWDAVTACCRQVTAALEGRQISALSIDATSGTILLTDKQLHPLTEALMYDDGRAAEESAEINNTGEEFWTEMGYRTQRSWALPKLLWLVRKEPQLLQQGFLTHQNDYIHARLAGARLSADSSHALKTGYDLTRNAWPFDLFDRLGLPPAIFPNVVTPGTVIGTVSQEAAEATGLTPGCLIVAGMTDGCASQIAAGAIRPGQWNSVLGTTLVLKGASPKRILDPLGVVYSHRSSSGTWLPGGASSVGAGMVTKLFPAADLNLLNKAASALEIPNAVMYPLAGTGERFPFTAPDAHSFTLGNPSGIAEEYASLLVGVACVERLCFDYLAMLGAPTDGEMSITGGGVKSAIWNQMRSDVLRRPLHIPSSTEAAFGAAILAASHAGSVESAVQTMVSTHDVIDPRQNKLNAFADLHIQLIDSLENRGWLRPDVAKFSRERATA